MVFDRNFGFSAERINEMENNATEMNNNNNRSEVKPYMWLEDMGLPVFTPEVGQYTFDVLQFPMDYGWHLHWADNRDKTKRIYDMGSNFAWWEREVHVHECFPKQLVCKRTFGLQRTDGVMTPDAICQFSFDHKDIPYRDFVKKYTVQVIRMHPNKIIGNTDYQLMIFPFKYGNFAKKVYEEFEIAKESNDIANMNFFMWNESGCSVRARFVTKVSEGFKKKNGDPATFIACDRIDFLPRRDQLTDEDIETVYNLHVDRHITIPTEEDYAWAAEKYATRYGTGETVEAVEFVNKVAEVKAQQDSDVTGSTEKKAPLGGFNFSPKGKAEAKPTNTDDPDEIPF